MNCGYEFFIRYELHLSVILNTLRVSKFLGSLDGYCGANLPLFAQTWVGRSLPSRLLVRVREATRSRPSSPRKGAVRSAYVPAYQVTFPRVV